MFLCCNTFNSITCGIIRPTSDINSKLKTCPPSSCPYLSLPRLSNQTMVYRFCPEIPVGQEVELDIITAGAGQGQVMVNLISPSGRAVPTRIEEFIDGFVARFTPHDVGPHTIHVGFGGQPVPQSPLRTIAVQPKGPEPAKGDPGKVKAYGPGLKGGVVGKPAEFTIDTKQAGPGGLGLTIEGPCEAKIECFDKGNGACDVRYWPTEPGEYQINLHFADLPVPNSPYKAQIMPSKRVDVSRVSAYGPGLGPDGKFIWACGAPVWE